MWGMGSYPVIVPPAEGEIEERRSYYHRDDKHLQSARDITGYPIQATDGEIGHVKGFLVDDRSWAIRELIIEAGRQGQLDQLQRVQGTREPHQSLYSEDGRIRAGDGWHAGS